VICYISDETSSTALFKELLSPALDKLRKILEQKCQDLLEPHRKGHPITYNHYFTESLQSIRTSRRQGELSRILRQFFNVPDLTGANHLDDYFCLQDLLKLLLKSTEPDMVRFASAEALDCMLAYYKVMRLTSFGSINCTCR
jgi:hypothetical protein